MRGFVVSGVWETTPPRTNKNPFRPRFVQFQFWTVTSPPPDHPHSFVHPTVGRFQKTPSTCFVLKILYVHAIAKVMCPTIQASSMAGICSDSLKSDYYSDARPNYNYLALGEKWTSAKMSFGTFYSIIIEKIFRQLLLDAENLLNGQVRTSLHCTFYCSSAQRRK